MLTTDCQSQGGGVHGVGGWFNSSRFCLSAVAIVRRAASQSKSSGFASAGKYSEFIWVARCACAAGVHLETIGNAFADAGDTVPGRTEWNGIIRMSLRLCME